MSANLRQTDLSSAAPASPAIADADAITAGVDELYIGYAPPMPPALARFIKGVVTALGVGVSLAAAVAAIGHVRLEGGTFDFGHPQQVSGIISEHPYPSIRIEPEASRRDSGDLHAASDARSALLVAPGKHGAAALVSGLDGHRVTLDATRIQRGAHTLFELTPGSIRRIGTEPTVQEAMAVGEMVAADPVTLRGEIVDSKCFLGVMVPGEGKTHKDCASLCLRGGIPPALLVRDRAGRSVLLLLVSKSGEPVGHAAVRLAGEPVEMTGVITRGVTPHGDLRQEWLMLRTDPATWRPLAPTR